MDNLLYFSPNADKVKPHNKIFFWSKEEMEEKINFHCEQYRCIEKPIQIIEFPFEGYFTFIVLKNSFRTFRTDEIRINHYVEHEYTPGRFALMQHKLKKTFSIKVSDLPMLLNQMATADMFEPGLHVVLEKVENIKYWE